MKNFKFLITSKYLFKTCLSIGLVILMGFFFTQNDLFALYGLLYLIFATVLNLVFLLFFLICAFVYKSKYEECIQAILILLINVPVAIICAAIGLNILN